MSYVLILFFHASILSSGDSNSSISVPGFVTQQQCVSAGEAAKSLTSGTTKNAKFVCVPQGK